MIVILVTFFPSPSNFLRSPRSFHHNYPRRVLGRRDQHRGRIPISRLLRGNGMSSQREKIIAYALGPGARAWVTVDVQVGNACPVGTLSRTHTRISHRSAQRQAHNGCLTLDLISRCPLELACASRTPDLTCQASFKSRSLNCLPLFGGQQARAEARG